MKNPLYNLNSYFSGWNFANFFPKKNTESSINIFSEIWQYSKQYPSYFWQNGLNSPKKSVLPTRDPLVTLYTKRQQFGPIVSVILSFSDVYIPVLQIKSGQ
jgi:hypothetical protein